MAFLVSPGDILVLLGAAVAFLLSVVFFARGSRAAPANYWGASFLLVSSLRIFVKFLNHSGAIAELPHLSRIHYPLGLATPVLVYLYVTCLLQGGLSRKSWFHFLPAIAVALYLAPYYVLPGSEKALFLSGGSPNPGPAWPPSWYLWAGIAYSVGYLGLTGAVIWRFQKAHPAGRLNDGGRAVLSWVRLFVLGGAIFLVAAVFVRSAQGIPNLNYYLFQVYSVLMVLACIRLLLLPSPVFSRPDSVRKYARSSLGNAERKEQAKRLLALLEEEEIFRRENLRIADVATALGVPEYLVSQVANEEFGQTFNRLVKAHRVRAVEAHLVDPELDALTMEAIGQKVGFGTRASFYSAFREATGMTPTEYREVHSAERS